MAYSYKVEEVKDWDTSGNYYELQVTPTPFENTAGIEYWDVAYKVYNENDSELSQDKRDNPNLLEIQNGVIEGYSEELDVPYYEGTKWRGFKVKANGQDYLMLGIGGDTCGWENLYLDYVAEELEKAEWFENDVQPADESFSLNNSNLSIKRFETDSIGKITKVILFDDREFPIELLTKYKVNTNLGVLEYVGSK